MKIMAKGSPTIEGGVRRIRKMYEERAPNPVTDIPEEPRNQYLNTLASFDTYRIGNQTA